MSFHRSLLQVISVVVILTMLFSGLPTASAQGPDGIERQINAQTGKVSFIGPENGQTLSAPDALGMGAAMQPQDPAMALAKRFGPEFGLKDPEQELTELKSSRSENGRITARYQQNYQGIPVLGGELIVNTNQYGDLYSMNGEVSSYLSLSTQPTIDSEQARQTALQAVAKWYEKTPEAFTASEPALWIYDERLLRPSTRPAELVWRMEVTPTDAGMPVRELVLVNAQRGGISLHFNQIDTTWLLDGGLGTVQDPDATPTPLPTETSLPTESPVLTETSLSTETVEATAAVIPTEEPISTEEISIPDVSDDLTTLAAATWYVATTGNDSNSCSAATEPCATINGAIGKTAVGHTIKVAQGTYTGTGSYAVSINHSLTLSGGWNEIFSIQSGRSIIDGQNARTVINNFGMNTIIDHFIIENGMHSQSWFDGGGITNNGVLTVKNSLIMHNITSGYGGGISGGSVTLNNSAIFNNKSTFEGGGIYTQQSITITNSTISNNVAGQDGGGIGIQSASLTITNSTITNNFGRSGGGVHGAGANILIKNSILADNLSMDNTPNCYQYTWGGASPLVSGGNNIIDDTSGCPISSTTGDKFNVDPQLIPFIYSHGYQPLKSTSPAINAGNSATCLPKDQRGISRVGTCDIGAYEYTAPIPPATSLGIGSGDGQRTPPNQLFSIPLQVVSLDIQGSPIGGVGITFAAPNGGASGVFQNNNNEISLLTNSNGFATTSIRANGSTGSYLITVSANGLTPTDFHLENAAWYVAPSGDDNSNSCAEPALACKTIKKAVEKALENDVIYVTSGTYADLGDAVIVIDKNLKISGGWNNSFTLQESFSTINGENIHPGIIVRSHIVTIEKFIIEFGKEGGVINEGQLNLNNSLVRYNAGSGIRNQGNLTLNHTSVIYNSAGEGGGIYNDALRGPGIVSLNNSIVSRNQSGGDGGGIYNSGTIQISNTGINNNSAESRGGGMINHGTATMNNVSIVGNKGAAQGGGIQTGGSMTLNNSTISGNTSMFGGGMFVSPNLGSARLLNTILAGNTASKTGPDCSGTLLSSGYNIIASTSACTMTLSTGDRVNINPQLGSFLPTEGYIPLLPTSPAVNAGNPATCRPTDQRGIARPQGSKCDIGAYEYTVPGPMVRIEVAGGSDQLTLFNTKFRKALQIAALDANGSLVSGVSVSFDAPLTSPSGTFAGTGTNTIVVVTNSGGIAQPASFTADDTMGTYNVIASASGVSSKSFSVHNGPWLVAPAGSDFNDCMNRGTACASLVGVLGKNAFQEGDPVWMSIGTYGSASDEKWIEIKKAVNVYGGWNAGFTDQIGTSVIQDTLQIYPVPKMELQRLTVQNTGYHGIANSGNLTVKESTIRNNPGTGIANNGQLIILNSTITQNGDDTLGGVEANGGVFNSNGGSDPNASITILNSTITKNKGDSIGGVGNYSSSTQPIRIQNSIVAGNIVLYGSGYSQDCSGEILSNGYNIIGNANMYQCEATWQVRDRVGSYTAPIDPMLDALQDLGNNMWVHPLKLGSPAIDGGPWNCDPIDQRGISRPQGGMCDIGAFEYEFKHNTNSLLITTYNAGNTLNTAKTKVCDQTDLTCATGDLHAKAAHKYAAGAYDFYKSSHNRDSLDGNGIEILSSVHYGSNYQNAFWNGHMMVYGDKYGYPLADDVVAHEFTHGVTQYESNLFYYYQSGAINESFSDLWGDYYDQTNSLGTDTASVKWLIGENVSGQGATRRMSNPPAYNDPDKMSSSFYYEGTADSGGVHTNSGVNNKAVYLMVNGGTFNGKTVTALGWEKTAAIYYEANTSLLSSGADYSDLYYALQQACSNLIGQNGITTGNCVEVKDALDAVEMNGQPATNFNPHAPLCTVNGTVPQIIFADDLETGTKKWTFTKSTYLRWQWDSPYGPYAQSGNHSLYADDYPDTITDASARLASLIIPTNAYLHFAHAYDFESGYNTGDPTLYNFDGGVLEYSINNGTNWLDASSLIDYNGYKDRIFEGINEPLYDNPLKGRWGFVGSSHGYISTRLNLASLAGKTVTFRWRMGLDEGVSAWGWWVDNIKVYTCEIPQPGTFNKTAPSNGSTDVNLSATLSWSTSASANSYQYCYDIINDNQCNRTWNTVTATSVGISNLGANTTYYWQVRAVNAGGTTYADNQSWGAFTTTDTLPPGKVGIETVINATNYGAYSLASGQSLRESYGGVDKGPVKITSTTSTPLIAAERLIYKINNVNTSFSEMIAMPDGHLDTTYWLPWYNNVDLDTQLRFANVSNTEATVHVSIGGQEMLGSPFTLAPGASTRRSFAGIDKGPLKIESDVNIVAAERVIYKVNGVATSFSEMMALPNSQLDTIYWLPWYNNVGLDTQLRIANVSATDATVHVTIGGVEMTGSPYTLAPGASRRLSFPNIDKGPVKIVSDQNIVAAERLIYKVNGVATSFSETMAMPNGQLDATYWLPWYNSKSLDTQLRIANVSDTEATVHVTIGGVEMTDSPFILTPGASKRLSYVGIDKGPVKIVSDQAIVAAERVIYKVNNIAASFSELMGLPDNLLDVTYWLPWYNNVDLDTQLRFGVP
jgi:Zn-dependent metalloprotease